MIEPLDHASQNAEKKIFVEIEKFLTSRQSIQIWWGRWENKYFYSAGWNPFVYIINGTV